MADVQSNIDIRIDTSSALASIKLLQAQISAFHTSMAKGTAENVVASRQLQQKLIDSINATQKFSAGIQTIKTTTESFTTALEKNKLSLGQYFKYSIAATKSFGGAFKTEMATIDKVARERVKDLQTQYVQLGRDANGAMKAIAVRPLVLDLENMQTKTALAAQKQQILNQLLKQGSTNLLNFGKNTQWAGRQLMVGFTIPLSMAATAAAKAYMDIEKASIAIARVYGDLNTSNKEVTTMVSQIKELAGEYTKYGIAVADTMQMAAKAAAMGKTGADLLAQVNQASKLSALGGVDQNTALDTTISLTNAFGIATNQLSSKINFLNAVENQTVLNIEDMTTAIPKAAPVVKQLGGDVEDLAFFLTAMKEGGINASEGANALKSGLSSLINPTKASSEFLAGFGVNVKKIVEDDKGNLKKTVVDFAKALDQIDPLNRARAIEMMFGKFQFARISTLLQNVNKEGSQASKALELANMSSIQLAAISRKELDKLQSSPAYKFEKSLADLQLKIAPIGETFLKAVTPIIENVSDFLAGFNKMGDGFKQFVVAGAAVLGGLAPVLLMVVGLVANGAANIIKMFANVKAFLNKTTTESQVLGETTNYLTTEQIKAEAVAASLDQTHSKLKQTFTSETSAIIALMEAYQGANAAMSRFNVPAVPTSIGGRKKFASGGMVRGPGGPTDDLVPTDLSNGEAVIDAATVRKNPRIISALFSGKKIQIPGYKTNNSKSLPVTLDTPNQYENVFAHIFEPLSMSIAEFAKTLTDSGRKVPTDIQRKIDQGLGGAALRTYGGLGFDTRQSFNDAMKPGRAGVVPKDFLEDYNSRGVGKWQKSLDIAGLSLDEVRVDLEQLDKGISDQISSAMALDEGFVVTDEAITTFAQNTLAELRLKGSKLAQGFDRAAQVVTEVRGNATQSQMDAAGYTKNPDRPGYWISPEGKDVDPSKLVKLGGGAKGKNPRGVLTGATQDLFRRAGEDTTDAYVNELERGKKKVIATAKKTTQAESDYILRNLQIRKKQAEMVGADTAAIEKEILARTQLLAAQRETIAAQKIQVSQEIIVANTKKSSAFSGMVERGLTRGGNAIMKTGTGRVAGLGMAASMATFALAGTGGPVGDIANQLLPVVNILTLFGTGLKSFVPKLMQFIPMIARFAGPVGLAITAVTGLVTVINMANEAATKESRDKLASAEKVIDAQTSMEKSFKSVGALLGSDVAPRNAFQLASAAYKTNSKNATQANSVQTLLSSTDFTDKTSEVGQFVESLKNVSASTAESMIIQYANTLKSSGVANETIDAFVIALQEASGNKALNLKFSKIDLSTKAGIDEVLQNTKSTDPEVEKARKENAKANKTRYDSIRNANNMLKSGKDLNGNPLTEDRKARLRNSISENRSEIQRSTEFKTFSGLFSSKKSEVTGNLSSMVSMLGKGSMGIKTFMGNIKSYAATISKLPGAKAALLSSFSGLGPDATKAANKVKNVNDQLLLMAYLSSHTEAENNALLNNINNGDTATQQKALALIRNPAVQAAGAKDQYGSNNQDGGGNGGTSPKDVLKDALKAAEASKTAGNMMKAGFGSSLIEALSGADKATIEFYTDVKNGVLVLNDQGKALEKAFNAKIIQDFNNAFAKKNSDMAKQITFQNALVMSGMKLADAQKLAADEESRAAYFAAGNAKKKQEIIDKLKQQLVLEDNIKTTKQKQAEADQKALEMANLELQKKTAENQMATKQAQINTYQDALNLIGVSEDKINETYDKRSEALSKIQKSQEAISAAQKDQLTVADALSKGDIAAAAKAAQDARTNSAQKAMQSQQDSLQKSKQAELDALTVKVNGKLMTRKQIEDSIKTIQTAMYVIQLQELDVINEKIGKLQDAANLSSANAGLEQETSGSGVVIPEQKKLTAKEKQAIMTKADYDKLMQLNAAAGKTKSQIALKSTNAKQDATLQTQLDAIRKAGADIYAKYSAGGMVKPKYFATGGFAIGTDIVPAMLTPGEFVVSQPAVKNFGVDNLRAINNGTTVGDSVYNYSLSVNMSGTNLNADDVARTVMTQIKQINAQQLRGNRF